MINLPKLLFLASEHEGSTEKNMEVPDHSADELSFSDSHVSPIHRLPVELLQNIFLLIVNDVPDCPSIFLINITISGNFANPPLIFTRVCRLWRVVAHSTTGLWSRIHVTLPAGNKPLKPFLPCLLQCWLARSGSQPLTLNIDGINLSRHIFRYMTKCKPIRNYRSLSQEDYRLLEILQSESRRWETVVGELSGDEWPSPNLDTPQLRTLECSLPNLSRFNAPNLRRLRISRGFSDISLIPICKNIRHLHFQSASPQLIRSISVTFPLLETIVVARISPYHGARSHSATHPCLESMTLPLPSNPDYSHWFTEIFDGLHLPVLRKLTLVGDPNKMGIDHIIAALAVTATCNVEVIDFQTAMSQDEVDVDMVERLLSIVRKVFVRGELLRCRSPRND